MPSYAHFVLIERWEVGEARIYGVFRESFPKRLTVHSSAANRNDDLMQKERSTRQ